MVLKRDPRDKNRNTGNVTISYQEYEEALATVANGERVTFVVFGKNYEVSRDMLEKALPRENYLILPYRG